MNFRQLSDPELARLGKEDQPALFEYMVSARRAGRLDDAKRAAQILAYSYERMVTGYLWQKIGSKGPMVVDELAGQTLADAVRAAGNFKGSTMGEFRSLVFTIARRRRADYLEKHSVKDEKGEKQQVVEEPWEKDFGEGPTERPADGRHETDPTDAIGKKSIFSQAFDELNQESHKLVICLVRFYDLPHKEVAEKVNSQFGDQLTDPMTEQNVNQINSRFDKRLDELLREAEDPPPPDHDD